MKNPIDLFYRPLNLIEERVYLFIVKGMLPIPVIFNRWDDETKKLVEINLHGQTGIVHASCLYMTKHRELEDTNHEN